jgi:hypothetical protein
MSAILNIYKNLYLNSNKSSKKIIFSKSISNNSYNVKISHFNVSKNISLIKPNSYKIQKKKVIKKTLSKIDNNKITINNKSNIHYNNNKNIFLKYKLFSNAPTKLKSKNIKNNFKRNYIMFSPCLKNYTKLKKLMMRNIPTPNTMTLSKHSFDQKKKKSRLIKSENHQISISFKRENNFINNLIEKQKVEIEKLQKKNKIFKKKLKFLEKENKNLNKEIIDYKNNQDQMILLIKIIQACGVDIDQLIDEYNNNITKEDSNKYNDDEEKIVYNTADKVLKFNESSTSDLDIKAESNSFIPITLEKDNEKKISTIKIPKLNFENIYSKNLHNKNYNKKQK